MASYENRKVKNDMLITSIEKMERQLKDLCDSIDTAWHSDHAKDWEAIKQLQDRMSLLFERLKSDAEKFVTVAVDIEEKKA